MSCPVCEFADVNGWHGFEGGRTHCRGCHREWRGTRAAHCVMCHETFTSDSACQAHKAIGRLACVPPVTATDKHGRLLFTKATLGGADWALSDLSPLDGAA